MYPVSKGFSEVTLRLDALSKNGHHAEALLSSVFALEKSIRRGLRFCVLNRGFSSKQCDGLLDGIRGFDALKKAWPVFEKDNRSLIDFVGAGVWQHVPEAVAMRNKIVHGVRVYNLSVCADKTKNVRLALEEFRDRSISDLGCDPWRRLPSRSKPRLDWLAIKQPVVSN